MVDSNNFIILYFNKLIERVANVSIVNFGNIMKRIRKLHSIHINKHCDIRLMIIAVICFIHFMACSYNKIVTTMFKMCTTRIKWYRGVTIFQLSCGNFIPVTVIFRHCKAS